MKGIDFENSFSNHHIWVAAQPTHLNVYKNDNDTWDFTGALDSEEASTAQQPLLGDAPAGYDQNYGIQRPALSNVGLRPRHPVGPIPRGRGMALRPPRHALVGPASQPPIPEYDFSLEDYGPSSGISKSPVVMVYGLKPDKMNCQRLFNILCLYGNVLKVKFLKSKPGTAMVQMGDPAAVDRAIHNLSGIQYFGEKLVLGPSKQMFLTDSGQVGELEDKSPSFVDFSNSRNNRFTTTEQAAKNRIQKPAQVLHYFNAPLDLNEEKIKELCTEYSVTPPAKFTPFKTRSERSTSGLLDFSDKSQAIECLTMLNHHKLDNPMGRYPYILKLCFSTSSSSSNY